MNRPSNVRPLHLRPAATPTTRDRLQTMPSASPVRFYAGLLLTTATTLALQILFTRILSLVAWYHLAFFAISMAMFGLTAGAVWVYRGGKRYSTNSLARDLPYYTLLFALSSALALVALLSLAPAGTSTLTSAVIWLEMALALATPFFFSGMVVSLALTRSPYPVGRVYGVDLVGAGFGCLGVLVLLNLTDGPSAVLWTSAAAALAAYLFLPTKSGAGIARSALLIAGVLAGVAALNGLSLRGLQPIIVKGDVAKRGPELDFEHWNTFSRVAGTQSSVHSPFMWGPSPKMDRGLTFEQRGLDIDGAAYTAMYRFNGERASVAFLQDDLTNLVYALPGRKRAAVIGVGGGRDVLSAWANGAESVTGVEINPVFIRLLTRDLADYAGLARLPGMHFEVDEARSWFAASRERFDTIQMSMIDTWAATGAGAFTLSENGLYTVEAWRVFLDHLTPQGAFNVSRWFAPGEVNETGRMISLAMAVLLEEGAPDPARHIFLASAKRIATLVLARNPLSPEDLDALTRSAETRGFDVLLHPDRAPCFCLFPGLQ
ncbi:MAG: hypothetical protein EXQ88_05160 [Alphaproteobacteria bacterium]|nr:hypothetical protein [Alphaproteobacteria bacterium]